MATFHRVPSPPKPTPVALRRSADDLTWHSVEVQGRRASYGVGGDGPPVVFLHGWALGSHAYKRSLRRLTKRGCRVYAPALPGFAGTADLPRQAMSISGYAAWVNDFLTVVGVDEPVLVVGHSFGGGVAIKLAHDFGDRVGYVVLMNSVGGGGGVGLGDRPPWQWALGFVREMLPVPEGVEMLRAMRDDLLTNVVNNPIGLVRAGHLARTADLAVELSDLRERGLPVLALTSEGDEVIPRHAFEALCSAVGTEGRVIGGRHSWLLADPATFEEVMANVVEVQVAEHQRTAATSRSVAVAELLASTSLPRRTARALVADASPLWLMSQEPSVLAGDLALSHPRLRRDEVRAVARAVEDEDEVRLTVVARDRPGLLAASASVLAAHQLAVVEASAGTWPGFALHALTVRHAGPVPAETWAAVGRDLEARDRDPAVPAASFVPVGRAVVEVDGANGGRWLVRVTAPDQVGLLWAICQWFADLGVSIESLHAATDGAVASDTFIVDGPCDADALAARLSSPSRRRGRWPLGC